MKIIFWLVLATALAAGDHGKGKGGPIWPPPKGDVNTPEPATHMLIGGGCLAMGLLAGWRARRGK